MPKRVVKRYKFEVEAERVPLTRALDRRLLKIAIERAPKELRAWHEAVEEIDKFYAAPRAAMAAYTLSDHRLSQELAQVALSLVPLYEDNWNCGNALHFAHTALGLVAVANRDVHKAVEHLRLSGEIQGSPQLNSYGPSMHLARDLLRRGESAAVLAYLAQCRHFWELGQTWLNIWEKKVARGAMPTFFMHLYL